MLNQREREIAEAVRQGCVALAREAYEQAGLSGLCTQGRWELVLDALQQRDIEALIAMGRDDER